MGKAAKERQSEILNTHLKTIEQTLQVVTDAPASSLVKVSWDEVTKMSEQISKQATIAGMLWTEEATGLKELEQNMDTYFILLQALLMLSHGSTVGAGPTLRSSIVASTTKIVDSSLSFLKESVIIHGSNNANRKLSIPQLAGLVWEACDALKKTPTTNYTAIGRAITQVAVSLKDVLRELKDLKPEKKDPQNDDEVSSTESDLGNDLSPEEMNIAQFALIFVTDLLTVIKELLRFITSLMKSPDHKESDETVNSLERILALCRVIGVQADELGACLYPPQEVETIKAASEKILSGVDEIKLKVVELQGCSESFLQSCEVFTVSVKRLQDELNGDGVTGLVIGVENLAVST